ncbi:MAG TPA: hypothetical protein VGX23_19275 [Actinocrinis sp.]|nr:hypothetical protein [Actinocrinis sp.]
MSNAPNPPGSAGGPGESGESNESGGQRIPDSTRRPGSLEGFGFSGGSGTPGRSGGSGSGGSGGSAGSPGSPGSSKGAHAFNGGFGLPFPAGYHPYSAALLESLRPFVPPGGLDRLEALLCAGPIAVLRGPTGIGRQSAALGLLASLGVERFYTVDSDVRFRILDLRSVPAHSGLVLDGLTAESAARLRRRDLDRIGQVLADRESWLVLVVDQSVPWTDPDLAELTVELAAGPPPGEVVEAHLRAGLGAGRAADAGALLGSPAVAGQLAALPPQLPCAAAAALGRLLARHEGDPAAVAERLATLARNRVERELVDWFAALTDPASRFFAVALAFAEGEPVETVTAVAGALEEAYRADLGSDGVRQEAESRGEAEFDHDAGRVDGAEESGSEGRIARVNGHPFEDSLTRQGEIDQSGQADNNPDLYQNAGFEELEPEQPAPPAPPADPYRSGRGGPLRDIRALAGPHVLRTHTDPARDLRAEFVEPGYADRLLRHVWTEYRWIRPALVQVIEQLGTHPNTAVRRRAVAAVGALARGPGSLEQLLRAVVDPWARADDPDRNEAAAHAVWAAGEGNPELRDRLRALIDGWSRAELPSLRATAVWTLGRAVGTAAPGWTPELLTELAEDEQDEVVDALCYSLTASVDVPSDVGAEAAAAAVFELLTAWSEHGQARVRRVAELVTVTLAVCLERHGDPRRGAPAERDPSRPGPQGAGSGRAQSAAAQAPWPGLVWLAERSLDLSRGAGRLWAEALVSADCGRAARRQLDQWAERAEPYRERREALARLLFAAAGHDPARPILTRQALAWIRGPEAAAPRTGELVIRMLNIS